jgi:hypothetical protein
MNDKTINKFQRIVILLKKRSFTKFSLVKRSTANIIHGLSHIAGKIPGDAKLLSTVRRLGRFFGNPSSRVRSWCEPIARQRLAAQFWHLGEIRLIVDGTVGLLDRILQNKWVADQLLLGGR